MRRAVVFIMTVLVCAAAAQARDYNVLSIDGTGVTVEFTTGDPEIAVRGELGSRRFASVSLPGYVTYRNPGRPLLPVRRFFFEVPSREGVRLDILETDLEPLEGVLPLIHLSKQGTLEDHGEALSDPGLETPGAFASISDIVIYRRRTLAYVDLFPVLYDRISGRLLHARRIVIRLSFPPVRIMPGKARAPSPIDPHVVNSRQAAGWIREHARTPLAQRTPFEFALSDNWIRVTVGGRGLYVITYEGLLDANVNPLDIDPSTVRLFSGSPLEQPADISEGGSFTEDYHLTERATLYRGSGGASFSPGDSIFFYGLGVTGWLNDVFPDSSRTIYYKHSYETENVYWLTWDDSFSGRPDSMEMRSVVPQYEPGTTEVTTYEERLRFEEDNYYDPVYTDDRWFWRRLKSGASASFSHTFQLYDVVGSGGFLRSIGYGPYRSGMSKSHRATYYVNNAYADTASWYFAFSGYHPAYISHVEADLSNLLEGSNSFLLRYDNNLDSDDEMYMLWYEIFFNRSLRARGGELDFYAPSMTGAARFTLDSFAAGDLVLLDVTDHRNPVFLLGAERNGAQAKFEDDLDGGVRHYAAYSPSAFRRPGLELVDVPSLRDETPCPHMVIVYHERFRDAVLQLRAHHSQGLPGIPNPVVRAVDIDDIYSNFSGGLKDPVAIRNYMKFLYDNFDEGGEPVIRYLLLFGNGTYDPRDILGKGIDYVPFYMDIILAEWEMIENEDFFSKLDDSEDHAPDIAIGRLPVLTASEANIAAGHIIEYENGLEQGTWRNKIITIADDEFSSNRNDDFQFTFDAEEMCADPVKRVLPNYFDFMKLYVREYPSVGNVKPAAKADLLSEWSDGAVIVNYMGHGSPFQITDEKIFLKDDVYSLSNGIRSPLFLAFSCTVGDMESPYTHTRSIGQIVITQQAGGAIGVIAGVAPTFAGPNKELNACYFRSLFTGLDSRATVPVGTALSWAKMCYSVSYWNNSKYALIGDPALTLAVPRHSVEHEVASIDTLYTGNRYSVNGAVMLGGEVLASFNGTADIVVRESYREVAEKVKWYNNDTILRYAMPGKPLFRGSVDVTQGRFRTSFVVPRRCRTGPSARLRSYVKAPGIDGVGMVDTLRILPAPPDSIRDNLENPDIRMYFAGQATKVKAGALLIADISDPDGIAILENDPQSSIFLEFDNSGFPVYVTEFFQYDHGSSTGGSIEYPMHSGIEPGPHAVILRAFDNLGAASADTLEFEVVEEGIYTVTDIFNLPNPFSEATNFIFQLSSRADVHLAVYNVSGVKLWERRTAGNEGFNSIYWDGRDLAGDRLANGTYLYVLDVAFHGSYKREESVKGKVVLLR